MPERFFLSCFFCCSSSFQVLPPKCANATQSQTHQWVHMHLFPHPHPPSITWQNADSSEAFFRDITPTPTQVHSRPNVLSNLSSSVVGSIWQIVLKWTIQKGKKRGNSHVSNRVFVLPWRPGFDRWRRRGAWWETVITKGLSDWAIVTPIMSKSVNKSTLGDN